MNRSDKTFARGPCREKNSCKSARCAESCCPPASPGDSRRLIRSKCKGYRWKGLMADAEVGEGFNVADFSDLASSGRKSASRG